MNSKNIIPVLNVGDNKQNIINITLNITMASIVELITNCSFSFKKRLILFILFSLIFITIINMIFPSCCHKIHLIKKNDETRKKGRVILKENMNAPKPPNISLEEAREIWEREREKSKEDVYLEVNVPDDIIAILMKLGDPSKLKDDFYRNSFNKSIFSFYTKYTVQPYCPISEAYVLTTINRIYVTVPYLLLNHYIKNGVLQIRKSDVFDFRASVKTSIEELRYRKPSVITENEALKVRSFFCSSIFMKLIDLEKQEKQALKDKPT